MSQEVWDIGQHVRPNAPALQSRISNVLGNVGHWAISQSPVNVPPFLGY